MPHRTVGRELLDEWHGIESTLPVGALENSLPGQTMLASANAEHYHYSQKVKLSIVEYAQLSYSTIDSITAHHQISLEFLPVPKSESY